MGLGKPLFKCMIEQRYLKKEGRTLRPNFKWIPDYVRERHAPRKDMWSIAVLLDSKWLDVQKFIEKYHSILFNPENLKVLYSNKEDVGRNGNDIFLYVFSYILFFSLIKF